MLYDKYGFLSFEWIIVLKIWFIRVFTKQEPVRPMKADDVKAEFSNLEIHLGDFKDRKFKAKCNVTYDDQMLIMDCGKRIVRMHARNIGNVHLGKKDITIAGLNFEITENEDVCVVSGSIKLELIEDSKAWYKELWG